MESVAILLVVIFSFVLVRRMLDSREKARGENIRLLEEALRNPHLDRQMVEDLAQRLTGRGPASLGSLGALFLAVGWIGLFAGVGLLVAGKMAPVTSEVAEHLSLAGWLVGLIAFGCVSYPFALREAEGRRNRN